MQYISHYESPLGKILLAADEVGLTGYAGGIEKKIRLLQLEGTDMTSLFVPGKG